MNAAQRKADWARTAAFLKTRSFDVKFDLENTDYKRVENIGAGAYGVVCSAIHKKTGDRIAIKKIPNVFDIHVTAMRTYREIKILKHFHHDNVISIIEILKPKETMDTFKDIYVVMDLMESDLHRIIHSNQDLTDEHIRYFLYQLLRGLKYVHSANVIHRDLKPSNLLVNEDCQLKIGDFGMARGMSSTAEDKNIFMTQYVATRWYRAPEIMLSMSNYTSAVDVWSVGCILAEMLGRKHLFPGTDVLNQLKLIIGVLGSPPDDFLKMMQLEVIKKLIKDWGHKEPLPLVSLFPRANRKALDLLSKMLTLYPKDRITTEEALNHPYLSKYHDPEDEPICIPAFNFDFEKRQDLKGIKLRHAIISEIYGHRHSPVTTPTFNAVLKPVADKVDQGETTGLQAFLNQLNEKKSTPQSTPVNSGVPIQKQPNETAFKIETIDLTSDEKVFKIPTNSVTSSSLKVEGAQTIQTTALPSSRDIEMLSARLTNQKDVTVTTIPAASIKPSVPISESNSNSKENVCEKQENKTISDDTKATLKAALLNARKQRAENSFVEKMEQSKKVTALSRQKERMQRRKEKADRAKRKDKLKERTGTQQGIELSDADKELLLRWKGMIPNATTVTQDPNVFERALRDLPAELTQGENQGVVPRTLQQQQQQQHGVQAQVPTFIQPRPPQGQSCAFQGQVLYRVDNGVKKQPETRKSFPLESLSMISNNGNLTRHVIESNNHQNSSNFGFKSGLEISHTDPHKESLNFTRDRCVTSPMLKRNSTGSAVLSQESASKSVPWQESSANRLFGSHRASDPLLPGYNSPTHDSPQTSQSESGSTPSQGLSPLALFDDSTFGITVPSPKADYLFQSSEVPLPFQVNKDNSACDVPMFVTQPTGNNFGTQQRDLPQTTTLPNLQQAVPPQLQQAVLSLPNLQRAVPSQLKINPCPQEVTDHEMLSANISRTNLSVQTSLQHNSSSTADWVSMLSRQFSKYQVEDIYPPALIGTPKGTGGGYGVGLSIDQEMQEGNNNPDSAPLSASLLADWMDVSGNMSARELEAFIEAELTSPMALSYSDLNLTPS